MRFAYDALQRPTHLFRDILRGGPAELAGLERMVYGEDHPNAEALNLRGGVFQVYDGAGVTTSGRLRSQGQPARRAVAKDWPSSTVRRRIRPSWPI